MRRTWAVAATIAAALAAALVLVVVRVAQHRYERAFALRMAGTTATYLSKVTPPPAPPPPPRPAGRPPRGRAPRAPGPPPAPPPQPPVTAAARAYDLRALLAQARALRTLPGWSSDVEVYFGTAPLVDATAAPLSPADLTLLGGARARWRAGAALVPLMDRATSEVVGAVELRPRAAPHGPLPGGLGFALPAALLAVAVAAAMAFREKSLRRGGYLGAALLLAVACYIDVRAAARRSTDRWLLDTRRLLQEAATRLPPPRTRVSISDLAAIVRESDAEVVVGEPGESAPRRVRIGSVRRAVAAVLIGSGRWVELRATPAEIDAPRWLILLLPAALIGPLAIFLLRWAERTPIVRRRETVVAWGFLAPAVLHLAVFTIGPTLYALYVANFPSVPALLRDPMTWTSLRNAAIYALYVPVSVGLGLALALAVHRYRGGWGGRLFGTALMLPYAASVVAIALLWQMIFRSGTLALGRPDWLSNATTALPALMLISLWAHTGGQMLVFLSALQRIPQAYLDAARVDGAGAWRRLRRVTLPLLRPVTGFVVVTGLLSAMQLFTLVSVLTQGGPLRATTVPVHQVYQTAFGAQAFGAAAALAILFFGLLAPLRWPQLNLLRRQIFNA